MLLNDCRTPQKSDRIQRLDRRQLPEQFPDLAELFNCMDFCAKAAVENHAQ